MKWNMFVGALVVSLGLCSQSFGFDLLTRMLGRGGSCCQPSCCETSCCQPACEATCCEQPACEAACCEQPACCEPACCEQTSCCNQGCGRRCNLFGRLRGLFDRGCGGCGSSCCAQPTCC